MKSYDFVWALHFKAQIFLKIVKINFGSTKVCILFRFYFQFFAENGKQTLCRPISHLSKIVHSRSLFIYFRAFYTVVKKYIKLAEDWFRTADLWFRKRPLYPTELQPVWPDWAIFCTLGKFLKPLATINLPKSPTFLGNFCKGVKSYHFSSEIIFGQLLQTFGDFFLVTLVIGTY